MARGPRLTMGMKRAIEAALNAAIAGDGFDGGDFDGQNEIDFHKALMWVHHKIGPPEISDLIKQEKRGKHG